MDDVNVDAEGLPGTRSHSTSPQTDDVNDDAGPMRLSGRDVAPEPDLVQAIRYDGFMYAHTICDICGIKPGTLRQARWRARRAGQSDPMPSRHVSNTRRVVSIRDAVNWLQRTGRHVELLRLAEWYSDMTAMAQRDMRDHVIGR